MSVVLQIVLFYISLAYSLEAIFEVEPIVDLAEDDVCTHKSFTHVFGAPRRYVSVAMLEPLSSFPAQAQLSWKSTYRSNGSEPTYQYAQRRLLHIAEIDDKRLDILDRYVPTFPESIEPLIPLAINPWGELISIALGPNVVFEVFTKPGATSLSLVFHQVRSLAWGFGPTRASSFSEDGSFDIEEAPAAAAGPRSDVVVCYLRTRTTGTKFVFCNFILTGLTGAAVGDINMYGPPDERPTSDDVYLLSGVSVQYARTDGSEALNVYRVFWYGGGTTPLLFLRDLADDVGDYTSADDFVSQHPLRFIADLESSSSVLHGQIAFLAASRFAIAWLKSGAGMGTVRVLVLTNEEFAAEETISVLQYGGAKRVFSHNDVRQGNRFALQSLANGRAFALCVTDYLGNLALRTFDLSMRELHLTEIVSRKLIGGDFDNILPVMVELSAETLDFVTERFGWQKETDAWLGVFWEQVDSQDCADGLYRSKVVMRSVLYNQLLPGGDTPNKHLYFDLFQPSSTQPVNVTNPDYVSPVWMGDQRRLELSFSRADRGFLAVWENVDEESVWMRRLKFDNLLQHIPASQSVRLTALGSGSYFRPVCVGLPIPFYYVIAYLRSGAVTDRMYVKLLHERFTFTESEFEDDATMIAESAVPLDFHDIFYMHLNNTAYSSLEQLPGAPLARAGPSSWTSPFILYAIVGVPTFQETEGFCHIRAVHIGVDESVSMSSPLNLELCRSAVLVPVSLNTRKLYEYVNDGSLAPRAVELVDLGTPANGYVPHLVVVMVRKTDAPTHTESVALLPMTFDGVPCEEPLVLVESENIELGYARASPLVGGNIAFVYNVQDLLKDRHEVWAGVYNPFVHRLVVKPFLVAATERKARYSMGADVVGLGVDVNGSFAIGWRGNNVEMDGGVPTYLAHDINVQLFHHDGVPWHNLVGTVKAVETLSWLKANATVGFPRLYVDWRNPSKAEITAQLNFNPYGWKFDTTGTSRRWMDEMKYTENLFVAFNDRDAQQDGNGFGVLTRKLGRSWLLGYAGNSYAARLEFGLVTNFTEEEIVHSSNVSETSATPTTMSTDAASSAASSATNVPAVTSSAALVEGGSGVTPLIGIIIGLMLLLVVLGAAICYFSWSRRRPKRGASSKRSAHMEAADALGDGGTSSTSRSLPTSTPGNSSGTGTRKHASRRQSMMGTTELTRMSKRRSRHVRAGGHSRRSRRSVAFESNYLSLPPTALGALPPPSDSSASPRYGVFNVSDTSKPSSVYAGTGFAAFAELAYDRLIVDDSEVKRDKRVGEGFSGIVHRGTFRDNDVAIKDVQFDYGDTTKGALSPEQRQVRDAFLKEAAAMRSIDPHPNVLPLVAVVVQPTVALIAPFCERGSLDSHLYGEKARQLWPLVRPVDARRWLLDISAALAHLHANDIVHRDVAARNILIAADDRLMVTDFGMSRRVQAMSTRGDVLQAQTRQRLGPVKWMAPEQLRDGLYSAASDVWAMAVVALEISAREAPWRNVSNVEAAVQIMDGQLPVMSKALGAKLKTLLLRCFAEHANDRPSAREIHDEIGAMNDKDVLVGDVSLDTDVLVGGAMQEARSDYSVPAPAADDNLYDEPI